MAYISSTDVLVTLIPEAVAGTPATSGNRYSLPRKAGSGLLTKDYGVVASDTIMPGRNSNGSRRGNQSVSGSIEVNAITAPIIDMLIESAASGKFVNDILKAGQQDSSFTHVAQLASGQYKVASGCQVTSFTLTATAADAVTMSFDVMGTKQDEVTSVPGTFTNVAVDDAAYEYVGSEVVNIVAAGETNLKYSNLELVINQGRNARNILSSNAAAGLSVSGAREVTLTMTLYREAGVNYEAIFTGEKQEFAFDLGIAGYGRQFIVLGQANGLEDVAEDDMMITITVTGAYDNTEGTALLVGRLTE